MTLRAERTAQNSKKKNIVNAQSATNDLKSTTKSLKNNALVPAAYAPLHRT